MGPCIHFHYLAYLELLHYFNCLSGNKKINHISSGCLIFFPSRFDSDFPFPISSNTALKSLLGLQENDSLVFKGNSFLELSAFRLYFLAVSVYN